MTDPHRNDAGDDAVRIAREALVGTTAPDVSVLAAVQDGLLSVPAGPSSGWFDVPSQRQRPEPFAPPRRRA
ncbi:hypothetical protein [Cellulomonas edaphi]|uniref:Uncharacterized protein n=1 Tax=Cellulomonas edaphi TaxID=3053468 RepID=A0ABT7S3N2_9CELL|nr:hypothetical protein [Cellulomons edaphi]MDM7830234.1 hypothetical protein [Cellulomons edaphi]